MKICTNSEMFENGNVIYNIEPHAVHTLSLSNHCNSIGKVTGEIHKQRVSKMFMVSWDPLLLSRMTKKISPLPQTISQIKQAVERKHSHPNIIAEMLIRRPGFTSSNTLLRWQDVHSDWRGQLYCGFCSLGMIPAGQLMPKLRREKDLLANNNLVSPNTLVSRVIFFLKSHFPLTFVSLCLPWYLKEINSSLNFKRKKHTV